MPTILGDNSSSKLTHFSSTLGNEVLFKHKLLGPDRIPLKVVYIVFSSASTPDFIRRVRVHDVVCLQVRGFGLWVKLWDSLVLLLL